MNIQQLKYAAWSGLLCLLKLGGMEMLKIR